MPKQQQDDEDVKIITWQCRCQSNSMRMKTFKQQEVDVDFEATIRQQQCQSNNMIMKMLKQHKFLLLKAQWFINKA